MRLLSESELRQVSGGEAPQSPTDSQQAGYQAAAQAAVDNYGAVQGAIAGGYIGAVFGPEGALVGAGVGTIVGYMTQAYATAIGNNVSADPSGGAFDGPGVSLSGDQVGGFGP